MSVRGNALSSIEMDGRQVLTVEDRRPVLGAAAETPAGDLPLPVEIEKSSTRSTRKLALRSRQISGLRGVIHASVPDTYETAYVPSAQRSGLSRDPSPP